MIRRDRRRWHNSNRLRIKSEKENAKKKKKGKKKGGKKAAEEKISALSEMMIAMDCDFD